MEQHNQQRLHKIIEVLQERRSSIEVELVREMLTLQLNEARANLEGATLETFQLLQGEAKAYSRILKLMDRPSLHNRNNRKETE